MSYTSMTTNSSTYDSKDKSFLTSTEVSDCSFLSCSSFSSSIDSTSMNMEGGGGTKMYEPESVLTSIIDTPHTKLNSSFSSYTNNESSVYMKKDGKGSTPLKITRPVSLSYSDTTSSIQHEMKPMDCPKTPPRHTYRNDPSLFKTPIRSSTRAARKLPSTATAPSPSANRYNRGGCGTDVRFMPKRSTMRFEICRASILSVEKRRRKMVEASASASNDRSENFPNNSTSPPNSSRNRNGNNANNISSNVEPMTPLQTEFRRRMRGALLDVALHESTSSAMSDLTSANDTSLPSSATSTTNNNDSSVTTTASFLEGIFGNDTSFLADDSMVDNDISMISSSSAMSAYRAPPPANPSDANDTLGPGDSGRMFSFEKENNYNMFDTSSKRKQTQRYNTNTSHSDPYNHDQLHVLDRSANRHNKQYCNSSTYYPSPDDSSSTIYRNLTKKITTRKIPSQPSRILDAPELVDDYYLNLVSWGMCNVLAVALGQCVYLWHAKSGDIDHLLTLEEEDDYVTSVTWCNNAGSEKFLAVGTNKSVVQIWDTVALKKVRVLTGHSARVGSLSWTHNCLTSGSRDSLILQHDLRTSRGATCAYVGHAQEVCGLKWNEDGTTLASGGNENYLCIWDAAMSGSTRNNSRNNTNTSTSTYAPRLVLTQHNAAVKALAWCPFHKGLLASGGGTADRTIKFWNSNSGALLNSIDTGSQVCSLLWSKYNKEICSSHGFSENQLILWRYPTMTKIQEFTGHTARVLHMEQSPDGSCVVSAAADETLRFWDIFGAPPGSDKKKKSGTKNNIFSLNGSGSLSSQYGMPTIR